jgi:hypothetical protein
MYYIVNTVRDEKMTASLNQPTTTYTLSYKEGSRETPFWRLPTLLSTITRSSHRFAFIYLFTYLLVRLEVFTAVNMKKVIFWDAITATYC